ncbi:MAG: hypothetical protein NZ580_00415 [Bacteroidia bacterium]|nr:hypothetical protein [Bacteroidia bacterium]MDW8235013.1 SIS domain-containing protein [Bacteroidia bacterium]
MWEWVESLGKDWEDGIQAPPLVLVKGSWKGILTLGMGGSAFGAEIVRTWSRPYLRLPWEIVRDYRIPAWVSAHTLVIAASYSGNTEETLIATEEALRRGSTVIGIASGGTLREWGESGKLRGFIPLPSGRPPRAAAVFSLLAQFRSLEGAELIPSSWREEARALPPLLTGPKHPDTSELKQMAELWKGRFIVLYAPPEYEPVALRARQQIQENAKHLAWHHVLPEMNHNEIVGWDFPSPLLKEKVAFWILSGSHTHPRNMLRIDFMENVLYEKGYAYVRWQAPQAPHLAEMMWLFQAVDVFSVYLAEAHKVDPTPVPVIDRLKRFLAQAP